METRRLVTVNPDGKFGADLEHDLENMDLYSETTSQFSALTSTAGKGPKTNPMSIQTKASSRTKSSKNRRKHERKKYSTKEGGLHEDIGLIASLHQIITDVYHIHVPEVCNLLRALIRIPGQFNRAKNLQESMNTLLNEIRIKETTIWEDSGKAEVDGCTVRIGSYYTIIGNQP